MSPVRISAPVLGPCTPTGLRSHPLRTTSARQKEHRKRNEAVLLRMIANQFSATWPRLELEDVINRLRKKRFCPREKQQGLKPDVEREAFAARLKPCPCYKAAQRRVFPQPVKPGEEAESWPEPPSGSGDLPGFGPSHSPLI